MLQCRDREPKGGLRDWIPPGERAPATDFGMNVTRRRVGWAKAEAVS